MTKLNHTKLIFLLSIISLNAFSQEDFDDKISSLLEKERKNLPVEGELLFDIKDYGCQSRNNSGHLKKKR